MAEADIQAVIEAVAKKYDADVVSYFGDVIRGEDNFLIGQMQTRRLRKNVVLMLTTYGGDPNVAYRIARAFQEAYKTVQVNSSAASRKEERKKQGDFIIVVDGVCKSAGTIICLGANKIYMSANSELGPIDVQLRKQDEVGERTSGLTPIQAIQFLETQAVRLFKHHFKALRDVDDLGFSTRMAADLASKMAIGLLTPIYQQIDPVRLAEVDRSLRIAKDYGDRLKISGNVHDDAIENLLAKYPSHGFVIDRREAKELFKNVAEPCDEMKALIGALKTISRVTLQKDDDTFVYYLSHEPQPPAATTVAAAPAAAPAEPAADGTQHE